MSGGWPCLTWRQPASSWPLDVRLRMNDVGCFTAGGEHERSHDDDPGDGAVLIAVTAGCETARAGSRCKPNGRWGRNKPPHPPVRAGPGEGSTPIQQYAQIVLSKPPPRDIPGAPARAASAAVPPPPPP